MYKEKGKTDDLRKLSTQNIIKIRFLLCKFVQACVGLKRDSSFLLLYCDETILRKYSPLIHSRFIMSSLKDHNHFVLMTENCQTKLVNKIRNIEESHDQTASSQVVFRKDLRM